MMGGDTIGFELPSFIFCFLRSNDCYKVCHVLDLDLIVIIRTWFRCGVPTAFVDFTDKKTRFSARELFLRCGEWNVTIPPRGDDA